MNKRVKTMIASKKIIRMLCLGSLLLAMLACEQPFKAGLGGVVDLYDPTVTLISPGAGEHIRGERRFHGTAHDDYKLDKVELKVTSHDEYLSIFDEETGLHTLIPNPYYEYYTVTLLPDWTWYLDINTCDFGDGDFKIRLKVTDSVGKWTETDEIAFFIKNDPPLISLALPPINVGISRGELGSTLLNYEYRGGDYPFYPRRAEVSTLMAGIITDNEGINKRSAEEIDPETGEIQRFFPPQIRFWQIYSDADGDAPVNSDGVKIFPYSQPPSEAELPWEAFADRHAHGDSLNDLGPHSAQFIFNLPNVADRFYAFQIRAQSRDIAATETYFPQSYYEEKWEGMSEAEQLECSLIIVYLSAPEESPTLNLWKLEAIDKAPPEGWNDDLDWYNDYDIDPEGSHRYIDRNISTKNGPFTLRLRARHSRGIASASVYFERDGGYKGRFIWDPADEPPYQGFYSDYVELAQPYIYWGLENPHIQEMTPSTRSFVFTYNDTGNERVTSKAYAALAGRSTVQIYQGPDWLNDKGRINTAALEASSYGDWIDIDDHPGSDGRLDEGHYTLYVTTRSKTSTPIPEPVSYDLYIDRVPPQVTLNGMEGGFVDIPAADDPGFADFDPLNPVYTVNGVVKPTFMIADMRPEDSRLRNATAPYFYREGYANNPEQVFVVVHENDRDIMESYIARMADPADREVTWLPISNSTVPGAMSLPDPDNPARNIIVRDGPIFNSACLFKVSPIYFTQDAQGNIIPDDWEKDRILPDGERYLLYAFARDNAFNVGHNSFPLKVDYESDKPKIDFGLSIEDRITEPNYGDPNTFETWPGMNRFRPGASIRVLRLSDDDGLDLGDSRTTDAGNSSVAVTMVGSYVDDDRKIIAYDDDAHIISLTQEEIKNAFAPQPTTTENGVVYRNAVKERRGGTISQTVLLDSLKKRPAYNFLFGAPDTESVSPIPPNSAKNNFHSLPDGLYKITVSVSDYTDPRIKLIMPDRAAHASAATTTKSFWIAVDSSPPAAESAGLFADKNRGTPINSIYISASTNVYLHGTVSDENGPIKVVDMQVFEGRDNITDEVTFEVSEGDLRRKPENQKIWEYNFIATINMQGRSGEFDYRLTFEDRFGVQSSLSARYSVDEEPPTVALTKMIDTFERRFNDVVLAGPRLSASSDNLNRGRLANKVISFTISATDNFKVDGIRWWLLPANAGSYGAVAAAQMGTSPSLYSALGGGMVTEYDAFPAGLPGYDEKDTVHIIPGALYGTGGYTNGASGGGAYGEVDMEKRSFTIFIDTEDLPNPDGEYRLFVIAVDSAGNISDASLQQEIFLLQEEDKPYFSNVSPGGGMVVGQTGLILQGAVLEDNGFDLSMDTLRIWLAHNHPNPALINIYDVENDPEFTLAGPDRNGIIVKAANGITVAGTSLNLNIPLVKSVDSERGLFTDAEFGGDGVKYIVIEATDAAINKYTPDGEKDTASRVSRRKLIHFVYDDTSPEIELLTPVNGSTYGRSARREFVIRGIFKDANLVKSGNIYKINWQLEGGQAVPLDVEIDPSLSSAAFNPENPGNISREFATTDINGHAVTGVYFTIPATDVYNMLHFEAISPGSHTLSFSVTDSSGKTGSDSVTFIKDMDPPSFSFTNIGEARLADLAPTLTFNRWWANNLTGQEYQDRNEDKYDAIHEYENRPNARSVVIYYDTGGMPVLAGTFEDGISDIDTESFEYQIDNEPVLRTAATFDGSGRNYRWTIDLAKADAAGNPTINPLDDGMHTIRFRIADTPGNWLDSEPEDVFDFRDMYVFLIDSKRPVVEIQAYNADDRMNTAKDIEIGDNDPPAVFGKTGSFTNYVFTVRGTATDANLREVRLWIRERATGKDVLNPPVRVLESDSYNHITFLPKPPEPLDPPATSGPPEYIEMSWQYSLSIEDYIGLTPGSVYDLFVTAADYTPGNESDEAVWSFIKDDSPPAIGFVSSLAPVNQDDLDPLNNLKPTDPYYNRFFSDSLRIQGSVTDTASGISRLESSVWQWDYMTGKWAEAQGWGLLTEWQEDSPGTGRTAVTDLKGNTSASVQWTKDLTHNVPYVGENGNWHIELIDTGIAYDAADVVNISGGNWQINGNTAINGGAAVPVKERADGLYRINLRAKDSSIISNGTELWDATGNGNPVYSDYVYFYYDRNNPAVSFDVDQFISSANSGGELVFPVTITDQNRFRTIQAELTLPGNVVREFTITADPVYPKEVDKEREVRFTVPNGVEDGLCRVKVTVFDMAGRWGEATRSFTLDNTPPVVTIDTPRRNDIRDPGYEWGGEKIDGGQDNQIRGSAADRSETHSESGIASMWYHIGFVNGTDWPNQAAIEAVVKTQFGGDFDAAADYVATGNADVKGNSWFRLGGVAPRGFVVNPNIHDWVMDIPDIFPGTENTTKEIVGGLKQYSRAIEVKGRDYNGSSTHKMVRPVPRDISGEDGIVSMPLYIRVTDRAGNVSYEWRDIWFYPDGDIPVTTINGLPEILDPDKPDDPVADVTMGGTVSVDGNATNVQSVNSVIFRVRVDKKVSAGGNYVSYAMYDPDDEDNIIELEGNDGSLLTGDSLEAGRSEWEVLVKGGVSTKGWYYANRESAAGNPSLPWNFNFNSLGEITNLIKTEGFYSGTGLPAGNPEDNNMIRVYLEVFAFSGKGQALRSSFAGSDRIADIDRLPEPTPKPYIRIFYIKNTTPEIKGREAGSFASGSPAVTEWQEYRGQGSTDLRSGRFAVRALLDAAEGRTLRAVFIRLGEEGGGWQPAWNIGDDATGNKTMPGLNIIPVDENGDAISPNNYNIPNRWYRLTMSFDSRATDAVTGFNQVKGGAWSEYGGKYPIEIRIQDDATPWSEAIQGFEIDIDNFAPAADPLRRTNPRAAGTNQDFMGRVFDFSDNLLNPGMGSANAPRDISHVYVWLTKRVGTAQVDSHFIKMMPKDGDTEKQKLISEGVLRTGILSNRNVEVAYDPVTDNAVSVKWPMKDDKEDKGTPSDIRYPAEIDTSPADTFNENGWVLKISGSTAIPGSVPRMSWIPNPRSWDITWMFQLDTEKLPDGLLTLHYIVEDTAGNASHHTQVITVGNSSPEIDRITLYTDNNGIGAVYETHDTMDIASTEYYIPEYRSIMTTNLTGTEAGFEKIMKNFGYLNSGFISKNSFIGFKVETMFGNNALNYSLQYVKRQQLTLTAEKLQAMVDNRTPSHADYGKYSNLYTIASLGDYTNPARWRSLGAHKAETPIGTHFVLALDAVPAGFEDSSAIVWQYELVGGLKKATPAGGLPKDDGFNPPVLPNNANPPIGEPGHGFNFQGADFDVVDTDKINEFFGSLPDNEDNDPCDTAFFLITVWDSLVENQGMEAQLHDAVVVGMNVYLTDPVPPTIRLYDLNPYTENAVTGNNVGDSRETDSDGNPIPNLDITIRNAANPRGIGDNILRGGLFNANTERDPVSSGHIEPRDSAHAASDLEPKDTALYPRVKNPGTGQYYNIWADGYVEGDSWKNKVKDNSGVEVEVARDMVSGKVILRGQAYDNQLIREIRIHIGASENTDLYHPVDGQGMAVLRIDTSDPLTNPNFRKLQPVNGAQAWAVEEMHWKDGHTVEWAYVWDTEKLPAGGAPAGNIGIWVAAIDENGNGKAGLASTKVERTQEVEAQDKFKTTAAVDIVPYITGFRRYGNNNPSFTVNWSSSSQQPRYATRRSRQGWYSFFRGETNIAAFGYNLKGPGATAMNIQTGGSASYNLTTTGTGVPTQTVNRIVFAVPNNTSSVSGKIRLETSVTVNGSEEALNHRTNADQSWNREGGSFTPGSQLWTNKPYAHIWRSMESSNASDTPVTYFGNKSEEAGSHELSSPSMALEYTGGNSGRLTGVWSVYRLKDVYYGRNSHAVRNPETPAKGSGDEQIPNHQVGRGFYSNTHQQYSGKPIIPPDAPYVGPDVSFYNGSRANGTIVCSWEAQGGRLLLRNGTDFNAPFISYDERSSHYLPISTTGNSGNNTVANDRWQNSRALATGTTSADSHGIAYNAVNGRLYYARGSVVTGSGSQSITASVNIDGSGATSGIVNNSICGTISASSNAGLFCAIDYDSTGLVVAYYDTANNTLRLAYSNSVTPNSTGSNWTRRYVLPANHALRQGSGRYVSMKVDKENNIHLAFYNSIHNTIVYAVGTRTGNFTAYAVDTVVSGGVWTDISVDNEGNPWIVYGDNFRIGSYDGARIAYRTNSNTASGGIRFIGTLADEITGHDITGWEAVSVPSDYVVNNDRLNIEAWPPTVRGGTLGSAPGWHAAIGYGSDMFRLAYFYRPTWKDY
ncbi:MAG: hypothetical protein FWG46_00735 [Treponema sp.]|nr:hypothetical protein [Treponema sp.]